jgi:hypothetical protein
MLSVGRLVRPGGVFVFQIRGEQAASALGVDWLLATAGFTTEQRFDGERRALVIARRRALPLRRAA